MYDEYKSMDFKLICNQRLGTYSKLWGINPMGLSSPCDEYIEIVSLHPVKKYKAWNQWALVPLGQTIKTKTPQTWKFNKQYYDVTKKIARN